MKISGAAVLVIGLGVGLLAGHGVALWFKGKVAPVAVEQKATEVQTGPRFVIAADTIKALQASARLPAADWAALVQEGDTYRRERVLATYVDTLSTAEIPEIVAKVEAGFGPGKEGVLAALAGRWVEIDPQAALAAARKEHLRNGIRADVFDSFYGSWASRDLAGAIAATQQLPDGQERGEAIWAIVYQMAESDPVKADALFRSVHASNLGSPNHFIYSIWAAKNLNDATRALLDPSRFGNEARLYDAMAGIVDQLMLADPRKAGAWAVQLPAGYRHDEAVKRLVERWARIDPRATVDWVQSLPDLPLKQAEIQEVIQPWAENEPLTAFQYAAGLPEDGLKSSLMETCVRSMGEADGAKALAWAQALPPSPEKVVVLAAVIKSWALSDPVKAAKALESIPSDRPGATVFPGPADDVYASVATVWMKVDPAATKAWLDALSKSTRRDAAMQVYCMGIENAHPREATAAAETMENSNYRDGTLMSTLRAWLKADRATGTVAVKASSLNDDEKKVLLDGPRSPYLEIWR